MKLRITESTNSLNREDFKELVELIRDSNITKSDVDKAFSFLHILDKLSSAFEIPVKGTPNTTPLPGDEPERMAWIATDGDDGYTIGISGDPDNYYGRYDSDTIYVYVWYSDEDADFNYSKAFDYYTELDKAVDVANTLVYEFNRNMSIEEAKAVAEKYLEKV